jgi:transposase
MGAPKKADWREERRKRAWNLKQQGWKRKEIAIALGVTEGAVSQWIKQGREGGEEAFKAHPRACTWPACLLMRQSSILII